MGFREKDVSKTGFESRHYMLVKACFTFGWFTAALLLTPVELEARMSGSDNKIRFHYMYRKFFFVQKMHHRRKKNKKKTILPYVGVQPAQLWK
jgi:hypothetical protein